MANPRFNEKPRLKQQQKCIEIIEEDSGQWPLASYAPMWVSTCAHINHTHKPHTQLLNENEYCFFCFPLRLCCKGNCFSVFLPSFFPHLLPPSLPTSLSPSLLFNRVHNHGRKEQYKLAQRPSPGFPSGGTHSLPTWGNH